MQQIDRKQREHTQNLSTAKKNKMEANRFRNF